MAFAHCHMKRGIIVDASLIRVGAIGEKKLDDVEGVVPPGRTRLGMATRQGYNQRRKSGMIRRVWIRADLKACSHLPAVWVSTQVNCLSGTDREYKLQFRGRPAYFWKNMFSATTNKKTANPLRSTGPDTSCAHPPPK
jgi:hypothetical protein